MAIFDNPPNVGLFLICILTEGQGESIEAIWQACKVQVLTGISQMRVCVPLSPHHPPAAVLLCFQGQHKLQQSVQLA